MPRETKKENYRKASDESFTSVVRSFSEVNRSLTEFSKASFGRAIEMQAQLAKKASESYFSEAAKLGQMFLVGYGRFGSRIEERPEGIGTDGGNESATRRNAAHRMATERKTGAAKRRSLTKRHGSAKTKR